MIIARAAVTAFALATLIIQPPIRAQSPGSEPEGVVTKPEAAAPSLDVLENGLRVIVVERRSARLAAIDLRVRAGTAYETAENNGVAHAIEHLLFKGTVTRKPGDVDAAIEAVGGELSANTAKDWAKFATVIPSSAWRQALEVLADAVRNPAFRAEDIEIERRVILDEIATADDDPTRAPYAALAQVAFPPDHPYRLPLHGPPANVLRLAPDDLRAFWRARYVPANMTLVVVGDVKREDVVGAARALFGPSAAPTPASAVELPDPGPIPAIVRAAPRSSDRALVSVVVGFRAPSVKAVSDAVALDVLLQILASGGRGRLHEALVRRTNRALAVSADYLTQRAPGLMTLTAVGQNEIGSAKQLEEALIAEVVRLREDGVTPSEVETAQRALIGNILFEEETFAGQANSLAFYDAIDSYEFAVKYRERVAAVGRDDIARVVRTYLTPERYAVATVGPRPAGAPPAAAPVTEASR